MPSKLSAKACPCGSRRLYQACCRPWHLGLAAPSAAALMRSRYSAYALGLAEYLLSTWHPTTRPATLELTDGLRWLGLEVGPHTQQSRTQATVEFVARYEGPDGPNVLHEVSRFLKEGERWYYVDGQFPDAPAE